MAIELSVTPPADVPAIILAWLPHLVVGVEEHPIYPGNLVFLPDDSVRQRFYEDHSDWLSRFMTLSDTFMLGAFADLLERQGYRLIFMESTRAILTDYARWSEPLEVAGFQCPNDGALFGYQTFGIRRALERAQALQAPDREFMVNWSAGAGKSLFATAGAQEMVNRDMVDLVLAVTTAPLKINLLRFFENCTKLDAVMVEGTPAKRLEKYDAITPDSGAVLVLNYDRFRFDHQSIAALTRGKRVLFIFDEVQKILTDKGRTLTRKMVDDIVEGCTATIWAMSASVVRASPLRYRDIFAIGQSVRAPNPLGSKTDFEHRYVQSRKVFRMPGKYGGSFEIETLTWNLSRLHEVRHRVADRVHAIRKTDPAIKGMFKDMTSLITPVQMSREDARLYDAVIERADQARQEEEGAGLAGYAILLRHICNNPLALLRTEVEFGAELARKYPRLITSAHSAKLAILIDQLEGIRDAGDKCVLFTSWVSTSLELIADELRRRDISHVTHHGEMTRTAAQLAQDQFRGDPGITVFLSSDAGAFGLNLPEAKFVISYEPTFSWDILMQRSERINRADSQLEGLTAFTLITDDSIEQRIAQVCDDRRLLAASTLGTVETLNTADETPEQLAWLIFG